MGAGLTADVLRFRPREPLITIAWCRIGYDVVLVDRCGFVTPIHACGTIQRALEVAMYNTHDRKLRFVDGAARAFLQGRSNG